MAGNSSSKTGLLPEPSELTKLALDTSRCFLCGKQVGKPKQHNVQVVPGWMLDEYRLWHQAITFNGREDVKYGDLKLTSCARCQRILEKLEQEVKKAIIAGPAAVRALPPERLLMWLAKLYHGFFVSDAQLLLNPANPIYRRLSYQGVVNSFTLNYLLLKRLLGQVTWSKFPASIFIFETLIGDKPKDHYDYFDAPDKPFFTLRCGKTFIVAALQDFGTMADYGGLEQWPQIAAADSLKLHPMQCMELYGVFRTIGMSSRAPQIQMTIDESKYHIEVLKPGEVEGLPSVHPWEAPAYETVFRSLFRARDLEMFSYHGHKGLPTTLLDSNNQPLQAPGIDADIVEYAQ